MQKKKNIEKLYYLHLGEMSSNLTKERKEINKKLNENIEELKRTLTKSQKRILNNIIDIEGEILGQENKHTFVYAYSIATKLIIESLYK